MKKKSFLQYQAFSTMHCIWTFAFIRIKPSKKVVEVNTGILLITYLPKKGKMFPYRRQIQTPINVSMLLHWEAKVNLLMGTAGAVPGQKNSVLNPFVGIGQAVTKAYRQAGYCRNLSCQNRSKAYINVSMLFYWKTGANLLLGTAGAVPGQKNSISG